MEKFYLKNGTEVKIGDTLTKTFRVANPLFGKGITTNCILVTRDTIPILIKDGILFKREDSKPTPEIPMDMEFYIQKIAEKLDWKIEKVYNYLNSVDTILPAAAFSMILREVAIELDKKYEDHIENSPEIYVISLLNGKITKANKAHIRNYRNFAAFRSVNDAKLACSITRDVLKDLFKSGK